MQRHNQLHAQFILLSAIRAFFTNNGFLDVLTPPVVTNPGMETHIHPFQLYSAHQGKLQSTYLHTSPEFHMKELLSLGFENIFTLSYCFRDEPRSDIHREQFIMLEWYRSNQTYTAIMNDIENLISKSFNHLSSHGIETNSSLKNISYQRATIQELFEDFLKLDILQYLETDDLYNLIENDFKDVPLPHKIKDKYSWDDLFFLLFLNKVEPHLVNYPYILLYEFPHHLSALSTIKKDDPRVCERFEVYMNGIELCNCFNELCDIDEQKQRFTLQEQEKKDIYAYSLPTPKVLYDALERGLPQSAGIALGVERLLKAISPKSDIFWR